MQFNIQITGHAHMRENFLAPVQTLVAIVFTLGVLSAAFVMPAWAIQPVTIGGQFPWAPDGLNIHVTCGPAPCVEFPAGARIHGLHGTLSTKTYGEVLWHLVIESPAGQMFFVAPYHTATWGTVPVNITFPDADPLVLPPRPPPVAAHPLRRPATQLPPAQIKDGRKGERGGNSLRAISKPIFLSS